MESNNSLNSRQKQALENCNRDPIHTPGQVQSFGGLLVFDTESLKVLYASANLEEFLDVDAKSALESSVSEVLGQNTLKSIQKIILEKNVASFREHVCFLQKKKKSLQVFLYTNGTQGIVEIVPHTKNVKKLTEGLDKIRWLLGNISAFKDLNELLQEAVTQLQKTNNFDIVMAYRFRADDSGEVLAEARQNTDKTFKGLRFPAFDIPPRARDIFLKTPIRIIYDVNAESVPLVTKENEPLDMTLALLRGVHPIHIEYLKNMGVKSSMTLPIVVEGKLWGLFASHNYEHQEIYSETASSYELAGKLLNLVIEYSIWFHREEKAKEIKATTEELSFVYNEHIGLEEFWEVVLRKFHKFLKCDGFAYRIDGRIKIFGKSPNTENCKLIFDQFSSESESRIFAVDRLSNYLPEGEFNGLSGCLYSSILKLDPQVDLLIFRNEIAQTISWAGSPEKTLKEDDSGVRLIPRASFKEYISTVKDLAETWEADEISAVQKIQNSLQEMWRRKKLSEKNRALHRSNESLNHFASIASHDLRSPLRSIKSLSHFIIEDEQNSLSNESNKYLELVISRTNRLEQLLNALLTYSQVGSEDESFEDCDLEELVQGIFEVLHNPHKAKLFTEEMPAFRTQVTPLRVIFQNLLDNALKYNDNPDPKINIGFVDVGSEYYFFVEDNGSGIKPRYQKRAFEIFTSLHPQKITESSGVGLAVIKKILHRMNCDIWIEPTKPSRFVFSWPKDMAL